MGIDTRLENERGEQLDEVGDPSNLLSRLLPKPDDESFPCLRHIDPYGDTTFNRSQAEVLLAELKRIRRAATAPKAQALIDKVIGLVVRCQSEAHSYIKFYGD
jgi:hypothetical protein